MATITQEIVLEHLHPTVWRTKRELLTRIAPDRKETFWHLLFSREETKLSLSIERLVDRGWAERRMRDLEKTSLEVLRDRGGRAEAEYRLTQEGTRKKAERLAQAGDTITTPLRPA